jgi:hypothetical protein
MPGLRECRYRCRYGASVGKYGGSAYLLIGRVYDIPPGMMQNRKDRYCAFHQVTDMAAAVRRGSLRRPQEDQTLPKIAVAPDGDLIAGYRVAVVITAAVGGIVVVGERDRCDQTIPGNKRDPHADPLR